MRRTFPIDFPPRRQGAKLVHVLSPKLGLRLRREGAVVLYCRCLSPPVLNATHYYSASIDPEPRSLRPIFVDAKSTTVADENYPGYTLLTASTGAAFQNFYLQRRTKWRSSSLDAGLAAVQRRLAVAGVYALWKFTPKYPLRLTLANVLRQDQVTESRYFVQFLRSQKMSLSPPSMHVQSNPAMKF